MVLVMVLFFIKNETKWISPVPHSAPPPQVLTLGCPDLQAHPRRRPLCICAECFPSSLCPGRTSTSFPPGSGTSLSHRWWLGGIPQTQACAQLSPSSPHTHPQDTPPWPWGGIHLSVLENMTRNQSCRSPGAAPVISTHVIKGSAVTACAKMSLLLVLAAPAGRPVSWGRTSRPPGELGAARAGCRVSWRPSFAQMHAGQQDGPFAS